MINPNFQTPPHKIPTIKTTNSILCISRSIKPYSTISTLTSIRSFHDFRPFNFTTLTKMMFQVSPIRIVGQITHKELKWLCSLCCRLFSIFTHKDWSTVQYRILKFSDGTLSLLWFLKSNDGTSFRTSILKRHYVSLINIPCLTHMILKVLPTTFK